MAFDDGEEARMSKTKPRVLHVTSVHRWDDIRIFEKEARSLAAAGYEVAILVSSPEYSERHGVRFISLPTISNKWIRILVKPWIIFLSVLKSGAKIVHFHDPDLLLVAWLLTFLGKKIIYDAHEDSPAQILDKGYIPLWARVFVSRFVERVENFATRRFTLNIGATDSIKEKFSKRGLPAMEIKNFPRLEEFANRTWKAYLDRPLWAGYTGGIKRVRSASELSKVRRSPRWKSEWSFKMAGVYQDKDIQSLFEDQIRLGEIDYLGWLNREDLLRLMNDLRLGYLLFHPTKNHVEAEPNKLFEYMAAGVPVIASDFPKWKAIITEFKCGVCVDSRDPDQILDATEWIFTHPQEAAEMSKRGQYAALEHFHWGLSEKKLINAYQSLVHG